MPSLCDCLGPAFRAPDVSAAQESLAAESEVERAAVFTRPEVAAAMLDLCGYAADCALHRLRLLEPSFGGGDFLLLAVRVCCRADVPGAARRSPRSAICARPCARWSCISHAGPFPIGPALGSDRARWRSPSAKSGV